MRNIVEDISNKNYDAASESLIEEFHVILERKMVEMKKMVAAKMEQNSHEERMRRLRMDVLEGNAEEPKLTQSTEQQVSEEEEAGDESSMARSELSAIAKDVKTIMSKIKGNKELEAWTQSKITKSADYMNAVADYMEGKGSLDEARVNIVKARIRGGVVQRRQRVSNVPGMTIRGGQLVRMSASERRARKLGAKKAARKTKTKQTQILRKRKMSLMKRQRLGI
jgi:hypothetical protein